MENWNNIFVCETGAKHINYKFNYFIKLLHAYD